MRLIFEKSTSGHLSSVLPPCDVPKTTLPAGLSRTLPLRLPEVAEVEVSRHYNALERRSFGVNDGFYPLGSCTMKYNPKLNEQLAALPGFTDIHPLQDCGFASSGKIPSSCLTIQGALKALDMASRYLARITGMDAVSLQPAAGAHGEFAGMLLIKAWLRSRGESARTKILIPDSAHGTNPASASMAGFTVVNIPSGADGCVDIGALRAAVGPDTAGLMLTNPNTLGLFDPNIATITAIVHEAGGLCFYDGANLNAIMGIVRPGDMGFDVVHLNLHKTFSTPHGGGGPGAAAVGCKKFLTPFLPVPVLTNTPSGISFDTDRPQSIGRMKSFYGNFLVIVRALAYILTLGKEGLRAASEGAVLNANYLMQLLQKRYTVAYPGRCMHEFVVTLAEMKKTHAVTAMDIAKAMQDAEMHPPTMYFPLIVHEALMFEPTETESKETLDKTAAVLLDLYEKAEQHPDEMKETPVSTVIGRPDEVTAARHPVVKYEFP